jgi:single-strand DNA-binding protein
MKGFTVFGVGNVAADLELQTKGETSYVRVPLIANDYAGKDGKGKPREVKTQIFFVAFGKIAEAIAEHVRKGDQLIVQASVESNNYEQKGETVYDYSYVIDSFKFGAPGKIKREELADR